MQSTPRFPGFAIFILTMLIAIKIIDLFIVDLLP